MNIQFLQPYSFELNIGHAYNQAIEMLTGDPWICITDQDTLKPPKFAERLKMVLETLDDDVIVSCMTNRLHPKSAQVVKQMYNVDSLSEHLAFAERLYRSFGTQTTQTIRALAGVMLCFKKSTWEKLGRFEPNTIRFDIILSAQAKNAGTRLLIANGLYIIHLYRWGKKDPHTNIDHLLAPSI